MSVRVPSLGPLFGPSWGDLGRLLGRLGAILGASWAVLGHLEAILGRLGCILGRLGPQNRALALGGARFFEKSLFRC